MRFARKPVFRRTRTVDSDLHWPGADTSGKISFSPGLSIAIQQRPSAIPERH